MNTTPPSASSRRNHDQFDWNRRNFLSLPALGGMLLLSETSASAELSASFVQENLSASDSLMLYTNLLPEVRKSALERKLEEIGLLKELASGQLEDLINLAKTLRYKYPGSNIESTPALANDFRTLLTRVENTSTIRQIIDRSRNELPRLASIDALMNRVHDWLLIASDEFVKARAETNKPARQVLVNAGKAELNKAIDELKTLLQGEIDETRLNTPTERLITLLRGVNFAIEKEYSGRHHAAMPYKSIMEVLRTHVKPGSWLQLGIGYAVSFPVLLRNPNNPTLREKLLLDALRLVPGLIPSPLVQAAAELSTLSL